MSRAEQTYELYLRLLYYKSDQTNNTIFGVAGFEQHMNINVAIQAAAGAKEYFEFVAPVALANFIYLYDWVIYERKRGRMRRVRGRHHSENFNPNSIQCIR